MLRTGPGILVVPLAALAALTLVPSASAAIWLELDPGRGVPGSIVRGHTVGPAMSLIPSRSLSLFWADETAAQATQPNSSQLLFIGDLVGDEANVGRITFPVPDVPPGRYVLIAHCRECAANGTSFHVGQFVVLPTQVSDAAMLSLTSSPSALMWVPIGVVIVALRARLVRRRWA